MIVAACYVVVSGLGICMPVGWVRCFHVIVCRTDATHHSDGVDVTAHNIGTVDRVVEIRRRSGSVCYTLWSFRITVLRNTLSGVITVYGTPLVYAPPFLLLFLVSRNRLKNSSRMEPILFMKCGLYTENTILRIS